MQRNTTQQSRREEKRGEKNEILYNTTARNVAQHDTAKE
jgi:hypothetical protein